MGNLLSFDDENDGELPSAMAREQLQQRQRAQVLLLSQLRQETGGPAALGLRPMQQPSLRQTQVFKNPLHVRAKSVQLSCAQNDEVGQWQLSFIFDALVSCEVLVHVGRCSVEVRQSLHPEGETGTDVVVSETSGEYRWVSRPVQFREGLNQEFRGPIELGDFVAEAQPENVLDTFNEGLRPRTQGFCIELKAVKSRRSSVSRDRQVPSPQRSRSQSTEARPGDKPRRRPSEDDPTMARNDDASQGSLAAEWTTGRFVRRDCGQVSMDMAENPAEVVEAKILSQSVKLPDNSLAPCYSMYEVYGADPSEGSNGAECAICMSERRDTAVLPCRHMCLCSGCAETMRTQIQYHSYRCPICRERVSSLLQKRPES